MKDGRIEEWAFTSVLIKPVGHWQYVTSQLRVEE
ncbi:MAG: hypothetical protein JWN51_3194 [Phycisphaerales bacterium]|nr:hypothetical protein [Phycisphaerales bacterium]